MVAWRALLVSYCLIVASVAPAVAAPEAIRGWTRNSDGESVMMASPAAPDGYTVHYVVLLAKKAASAEALITEIQTRASATGDTVTGRSGIVRDQDITQETRVIRRNNGVQVKQHFFTYPVDGKHQIMVVLHDARLTEEDARVGKALDHVAALWRAKFALTSVNQLPLPKGSAAVAAAPAMPQSSASGASSGTAGATGTAASGQNCRREPVWGQRISAWCYPSGICSDRVIKDYETVCD